MECKQADLLKYLQGLTAFFQPPMCALERFILDHGKDFRGVKRPKGIRKRTNKMCYRNAAQLSLERGFPYVEGFAVHNDLIAVFHAWCINDEQEVVDNTWRYPECSLYRGVVIPREILLREISARRIYGVLDYGMINLDLIDRMRAEFEKIETKV